MITHTIAPYAERPLTKHQQQHRFDGEFGTEKHKEYIFDRALRKCKFEVDDVVMYKGKKYEIFGVNIDFRQVLWDGLTPLFIDIWDGHNIMHTVNPGVLKRKK